MPIYTSHFPLVACEFFFCDASCKVPDLDLGILRTGYELGVGRRKGDAFDRIIVCLGYDFDIVEVGLPVFDCTLLISRY